jgi:hypothetical protein
MHEELMAKDGLYRYLNQVQMQDELLRTSFREPERA